MKRILVLFGHNLRRERERKNWSIEDLATQSGLDVFTIRNLESGTKWPTKDAIEHLTGSLKVDPLNFFLIHDFEPDFLESLSGVPRDILNWLVFDAKPQDFDNIREYIKISREHRNHTSNN